MKNVLIFAATLMTIGCGTKNACEELNDAICACDDAINQMACEMAEASGEDPAEATDDQIEACEAMLPYECSGGSDTGM